MSSGYTYFKNFLLVDLQVRILSNWYTNSQGTMVHSGYAVGTVSWPISSLSIVNTLYIVAGQPGKEVHGTMLVLHRPNYQKAWRTLM